MPKHRSTAPLSGRSRHTHIAEEFALSGPSDPPDRQTHAYRNDLADAALAGRVIASHYAQPVKRTLATATVLRQGPGSDSGAIAELEAGTQFDLLDDSVGWAWGYAGDEGLVGYVESAAIAAPRS